jgi:hypothetical protein
LALSYDTISNAVASERDDARLRRCSNQPDGSWLITVLLLGLLLLSLPPSCLATVVIISATNASVPVGLDWAAGGCYDESMAEHVDWPGGRDDLRRATTLALGDLQVRVS